MTNTVRNAPWFKVMFRLWKTRKETRIDLFRIAASVGDIVRVLGRQSTFFINEPDAISHVLIRNEANYVKNEKTIRHVKPFMGPGLLTNSGEAWKSVRQQVQPEFYFKHLKEFIPAINHCTEKFLDIWNKRLGETVDVMAEMSKLALEVSALTLFGGDVHRHTISAIPLMRSANEYFVKGLFLNSAVPTPKNRAYRRAKVFIDQITNEVLTPPQPFADELTPALRCLWHQPNDNLQLRQQHLDEAKNFLLAGHETTATGITWALYLLAKNPSILAELLLEIDSVLNGAPPTLEQLDQLELTSMVIDETLRLYPSLWVIDRVALEDDIVGNYRVPAKSIVIFSPYTLHRHPDYWTDPEIFNPWRFSKKNPRTHPKNAYIPFGAGPRVCIGKQLALLMMKILLPMILQRFELTIDPQLEIEIEPLITLKPNGIIPLKLQLRK